jgi:hypothetical protein
VFSSWGQETTHKYTSQEIGQILEAFSNAEQYGIVLRAKGIVPGKDGQWIHFDYVPGECSVRNGSASVTGRICVIGTELKTPAIAALFEL